MSSNLNFDLRVQDEQTKNVVNASYSIKDVPFRIHSMSKLEEELHAAGRDLFKRLIDSGALVLDSAELIDKTMTPIRRVSSRANAADPCDFRAWGSDASPAPHLPETLHRAEDR